MSIQVIAHRGDSQAARENTLAAFAAAVEAGADWIELDVRTTRDGVAVVLHDTTLLRLWGGVGRRVQDMTLGQLETIGGAGLRVPTLAEALRQVARLVSERSHRIGVLVDVDNVHDARSATAELRRHQEALRRAHVPVRWCGAPEAMQVVREELPEARVAWNHPGGELDVEAALALGADVVNVEWVLLDSALVDQVHRLGMDLSCWTLNGAEQLSWAVDLGVDAITTDQPRLLRRLLRHGTSPLALAWTGAAELASRTGIDEQTAEWVRVARELAEWANAFTRTARPTGLRTKAHAADLVTEVDLAVEQHVREVVAQCFGDEHLVVGEEMGGHSEPGRPTWYLDPVDGTTNLANQLPWTSMSLALAVDGEAVVATVAQPALGHVFLAARDLGATLDGEPLDVRRRESLSGATVLTELDAHRAWPGMTGFLDALAARHATPRVMGSGTLACAGIAAGWAAAGVVHRSSPIDHLAVMLVAREAGAEVCDWAGRGLDFPDGEGLVVAAPGIVHEVLGCLPAAGR